MVVIAQACQPNTTGQGPSRRVARPLVVPRFGRKSPLSSRPPGPAFRVRTSTTIPIATCSTTRASPVFVEVIAVIALRRNLCEHVADVTEVATCGVPLRLCVRDPRTKLCPNSQAHGRTWHTRKGAGVIPPMETHTMHRIPTDYATRARAYRRSAARARAEGDADSAEVCEEFARRCDERARSLATT